MNEQDRQPEKGVNGMWLKTLPSGHLGQNWLAFQISRQKQHESNRKETQEPHDHGRTRDGDSQNPDEHNTGYGSCTGQLLLERVNDAPEPVSMVDVEKPFKEC